MEGLDRIPSEGPALIIFYHGAIFPIDYCYLLDQIEGKRKRLVRTVVDRMVAHFPGCAPFNHILRLTTGSVDSLAEDLGRGDLVAVAPGGIREGILVLGSNVYRADLI